MVARAAHTAVAIVCVNTDILTASIVSLTLVSQHHRTPWQSWWPWGPLASGISWLAWGTLDPLDSRQSHWATRSCGSCVSLGSSLALDSLVTSGPLWSISPSLACASLRSKITYLTLKPLRSRVTSGPNFTLFTLSTLRTSGTWKKRVVNLIDLVLV